MACPEGFVYHPGFLVPEEGHRMLKQLWRDLQWKQYGIRIFGRMRDQPRLTAWCADPGIVYSYSGLNLQSEPWHPALDGLRSELQGRLGTGFNSVLVNAYRDGRDAMGWHADDEPELGPEPTIASISLGAARRMLVRPRGGGASTRIDLDHGSLLIMQGDSQSRWLHCVPRTRKPIGLRINLTFRLILGAGGAG